MLVAVLSGYLFALIAPLFTWATGRATGPIIAAYPAFLFAYLAQFVPEAARGRPWRFSFPWNAASGFEVSLRADGLSLLLGLVIAALGVGTLIATAGAALSQAARARLLLAIAALIASSLGVVFADEPILLASFSAALSGAAFLVMTAESGPDGRARALPILMLWLMADLGVLMLLAHEFAAVPGGLMGAGSIAALVSGARSQTVWLVILAACKLIPVFGFPARASPSAGPASAALIGLTLPAALSLVMRFGALLPADGRLVLGVVGALALICGGLGALGSRRVSLIVCGLMIAGWASVIILVALGGERALAAALVTGLTLAVALGTLALVVPGTAGPDGRLKDLRTGLANSPLSALALIIAVLAIAGLIPSTGMLAMLTSLGAAFARDPLVEAPVIILGFGFLSAAALRVLIMIFFSRADESTTGNDVPIGAVALAFMGVACAFGFVPAFLARALIGPALRATQPPLLASPTMQVWLAVAASIALGLLFLWQQKQVTRLLWWTARRAETLPWPSANAQTGAPAFWHVVTRSRATLLLLVAAFLVAIACGFALSLAWPEHGLRLEVPDHIVASLALACAVAAGLVAFQKRVTNGAPLMAIAGTVSVLVALAAGGTDLAFLLLLLTILETVILLVIGRDEPAAPIIAHARLEGFARVAVAITIGAAATLAGLVAAPSMLSAQIGSAGITGFIGEPGFALHEIGVIAIESWAGIVLLLFVFGIVVPDLARPVEDDT